MEVEPNGSLLSPFLLCIHGIEIEWPPQVSMILVYHEARLPFIVYLVFFLFCFDARLLNKFIGDLIFEVEEALKVNTLPSCEIQ